MESIKSLAETVTPGAIDLDKVEFEQYKYLSKHKGEKKISNHEKKVILLEVNGEEPLIPLGGDRTENGAKAFSTTGNPLIDLFGVTVRDFDKHKIFSLMTDSWKQSPLMTYQSALYTRDVRQGKGEIRLGVFMMLFIRVYHPATYLWNLHLFSSVGYFKDLWRLLDLVIKTRQPILGKNTYVEIEYMAEVLRRDRKLFDEGKSISLASKWTPKEGSHYDGYFRLLANVLFPGDKKACANLRKWIGPMRKSLKLVESKMCDKKWTEIDYDHVPSYTMKLKSDTFKKHDELGFNAYLEKVKKGEAKINVTGLQPHELVGNASDPVAQLQWKTMIEKLRKETNLGSCLAVSDVSASMKGKPMEVSVALGLLLSLVQPDTSPFHRRIVTFTSEPQLHEVKGETLEEQVSSVRGMKWGGNTNFIGVFKLLLQTAKMYKVPQENMVKRLFVFTDMQFDESSPGLEEYTPFQEVEKLYEEAGYKLPEMVFWNLKDSLGGFPIRADKKGVCLVSGFSTELLKLFTEGVEFTPEAILRLALERYKEVEIHKNDL